MVFPPQASLKQLSYLLDVHTFSPDDVSLNQTTLTWPSKLSPIFEENEQVCEGEEVGWEVCERDYPYHPLGLPYYQLPIPRPLDH